ncbi:hypothetical protein C8J56DRAFT_151700 [Mycena floridula]|nr:hypothetical protein C8J56DRAFT_151700 [Mycena floridula]
MRQSQRIKAKPSVVNAKQLSEDEYDDAASEPKRKTTRKAAGSTAKLKLLPQMPLDILFEIFRHLEPKDLLRLVCVNKACHDTLVAPNAVFLWKQGRQRHDAPEPLPGFTEVAWSSFLFDGAICQLCGTSGINAPDFMIMKKACKRCLRETLWKQGDSDEFDESVLALVPYTHTGGTKAKGKYSWIDTLLKVQKKLRSLNSEMIKGKKGAQENWEAYKKERLDLLALLNARSPVCRRWYNDFTWATRMTREDEVEQRKERRREAVRQRIFLLGYEAIDFVPVLSKDDFGKGPPMTDRIWERIRLKIEPQIIINRDSRVLRERQEATTNIIGANFLQYLRTNNIPTTEWPKLPRICDLAKSSIIQAVLEKETGDITEEIFPDIPAILASWEDDRKAELWNQVRKEAEYHTEDTDKWKQILGLANIVFTCSLGAQQCKGVAPIISLDGAIHHHCVEQPSHFSQKGIVARKTTTFLKYSPSISLVASSLIRLAQLDPSTATPEDMDQIDLLYACKVCERSPNSYVMYEYNMAFDWRGAVHHASAYSLQHNEFCTLTDGLKALNVKALKSPTNQEIQYNWMCTHCRQAQPIFQTKVDMLRHVVLVHRIEKPVVEKDLMDISTTTKRYRQGPISS